MGGVGGDTPPPNVWKLQLENRSLHLELAYSMRTLSRLTRNVGPANLSWKAKHYASNLLT